MSHELKSWGRQRMYHFTFNGQKPAPPGMYEILSDRIKNLYKSHQPFFFFDIISQRPKTASPGRRVHLHMHWRLLRLLILGWVISTIHRSPNVAGWVMILPRRRRSFHQGCRAILRLRHHGLALVRHHGLESVQVYCQSPQVQRTWVI